MKRRSAIKTDLFADQHYKQTLDMLCDPLTEIKSCINFAALASEVDRIAPRLVYVEDTLEQTTVTLAAASSGV